MAYCSKAHWAAMTTATKPVFCEREIEFNPDKHGAITDGDIIYFDDAHTPDELIAGMDGAQVEKFCRFFEKWLLLATPVRDAVALCLTGLTQSQAAERLGVSPQAVSKNLLKARTRHALIDALVPGQGKPKQKGPPSEDKQASGSRGPLRLAQGFSETTEHNAGEVL
jgi:hypothetical protein